MRTPAKPFGRRVFLCRCGTASLLCGYRDERESSHMTIHPHVGGPPPAPKSLGLTIPLALLAFISMIGIGYAAFIYTPTDKYAFVPPISGQSHPVSIAPIDDRGRIN